MTMTKKRLWLSRDGLVFIGCMIMSLGLNIPVYGYNSTNISQLSVLSIDEWAYYSTLEQSIYDPLFLRHELSSVLTFNSIYGSLFWYVYALLTAPFHTPEQFTIHLITLRTISALWLGVAVFFVYKLILRVHQHWLSALLGACALFTMPALYFYAKPFSPEFMATALGLAALYALVRDAPKLGRWWFVGTFVLGLAIGTKLSLGLYVTAALMTAVVAFRRREWDAWFGRCSIGVLLMVSAFLISNPYIVGDRVTGWEHFMNNVQAVLLDNATGHGTGQDITWEQWWPFLQEQFWPAGLLLLGLAAYLTASVQTVRRKNYQIIVLAGTCVVAALYIFLRTNVLWTWYLFPSAFLFVIGLGTVCWETIPVLRRWVRYEPAVLVCLMGLALIWTLPKIVQQYKEVAERERTPAFQTKIFSNEMFRQWLLQYRYSHLNILKSPYIYLDLNDFITINVINVMNIFGTFSENHIKGIEPELLLVQKKYDFLDPEASGPDMQAARSLYTQLTTSGVQLGETWYRYRLALETDDFYVYERIFQ